MTDSERELYRRTVDDCRVVADGMASDDVHAVPTPEGA
jgi:hypothetical protein